MNIEYKDNKTKNFAPLKNERIKKLQAEIDKLKKVNFKLNSQKKYGLVWEDKPEIFDEQSKNAFPIIRCKDDAKYPDIDNLSEKGNQQSHILIEGDNYHSLNVLNITHQNKIDVIYIDPPYNTGNKDFKYNDSFVDKEDKFRHSKWLSFMHKRLELAKNLLANDGVIFISIDDNEQAQLKLLCDEVFGEKNLITILKIQVRYDSKSLNEKKDFQEIQEYVFLYSKNSKLCKFNKPTEQYSLNKFELDIQHSEKPAKTIIKNGRKIDIWKNNNFEIKKVIKPSELYFKETWLSGSIYSNTGHGTMYKKMIENRTKEDGYNCLYRIHGIGEDGLGYRFYTNPKEKKYTKGKMYTKIPLDKLEKIKNGETVEKENPIVSYYDFSADFGNIRHEGGVSFNSGKKPIKMLKQFIGYVHNNKNAIILDFFAGSGTTAHAVLELNKQDGGNRQCILATNNENGICEGITYERIKRVIKGYTTSKSKAVEGLGGALHYLKTDFVPKTDYGAISDQYKINFSHQVGIMLALKENTFNEVESNNHYQIFSSDAKICGIYFSESLIELDELVDFMLEQGKPCYLYAYPELDKADFVANNIILSEIPEHILQIYKNIGVVS